LFKAIFEIKQLYPDAYQVVIEYRQWLVQEILELLSGMETHLLKPDVDLFLFMIDGTMVQLLSGYGMPVLTWSFDRLSLSQRLSH